MRKRTIAAAFLLPFLIGMAGFALRGIAPFGDLSLTAIDGWGQYFPMLREAERNFFSGAAYSFSGGLGFDFLAQSAYYTNSPLWILLFLLPGEITAAQIDMMVLIRFGLAGASFFYYVRRRYASENVPAPVFLVLSAAYALSAFGLAFINQFMWMDAVALLPLVAAGIEKITEGGLPFLYAVTLALAIHSNFYMAYMICLFSVLWFVVTLIRLRPEARSFWKASVLFAAASLLAGAANLPMLLRVCRMLSHTMAVEAGFPGPVAFTHTFAGTLTRLLPFRKASLEYGDPNIYCGLLLLLPAAAALFFRRIPLRAKIAEAALLLLMGLSFHVNLLDYIWHGFHFPSQLPSRESFLFIFVLLQAAAAGTACLFRRRSVRLWKKALFLLAFVEITANAVFALGHAPCTYASSLTPYAQTVQSNAAELRPDPAKGEFFRAELEEPRDNAGQLYGFNGISYYSSTMSAKAYEFFLRLGMPVYAANVSTRYVPGPVTDDLFGVRYRICKDGSLIENPDALPPGFLCRESILEIDMSLEGEAFVNELVCKAAGCDGPVICEGSVVDRKYTAALEILSGCPLEIEEIRNNYFTRKITGKVNCLEDGILLLSLPAEDVTILVDGVKQETLLIAGFLAGVRIGEGEHRVEVRLR